MKRAAINRNERYSVRSKSRILNNTVVRTSKCRAILGKMQFLNNTAGSIFSKKQSL